MRMIHTIGLMMLGASLMAQCDFEVEITPNEIDLLCPGEEVTLMSGIFDSYQWFIDGEPIEGATGPSHTVTWYESGAPYTVEVTLDGCSEMSEEVWVDGHNWGFPWVSHGGDEPVSIGPNGEPFMCEGQVLLLELSPAFVVVNWTESEVEIPGEVENTLTITESGFYGAIAHPAVCPSLVAQLDLGVDVTFLEPQQPAISQIEDEICAFPPGDSYAWYHEGILIADETTACIMAGGAGAYTVYVDYGQNCQVISEPYIIMDMEDVAAETPLSIFPNPTDGILSIAVDPTVGNGTIYRVLDVTGREVITGRMPLNGLLQLDMTELPNGTYMFQVARDGKALASATRFTIVK